MATFNNINDFPEDLAHALHDLDTDQLVIALSNTAPASEASDPSADGNGVLANVTEVAYTNLSTRNITFASDSLVAGLYKLLMTDLVLTASGGSVAPFRYIYIYNDTAAGDPLICYFDYGSALTLLDGESLTVDFSAANGLLQISGS